MKVIIFLFIICCFLFFNAAQATNSLDVVLNEMAWMGTSTSANDEWIELRNNTQSPIDLSGWMLKAEDGSPTITLKGIIPALGYFLLERTDDKTLPNISADQIYTGGLENAGEKLGLYDKNGNLIDLVNCSSGWFSGDNTTKQTMERKKSKIRREYRRKLANQPKCRRNAKSAKFFSATTDSNRFTKSANSLRFDSLPHSDTNRR